ncbi:hypothetical protein EUX98_g6868 [Antrodiella citrinella]|uniref:NADAR domain-containing protein n=1 Tax=Antrodiella citrinella TaxID=2447956 RepID=A0A4S4MPP7_9APHY|nr:hypothetical protein EUX98_g6868 [Antrodiella citrinella]
MASTLYPPTEAYTAEQWSRRIYQLQNTIYGPPHLTISTDDFHSRRSSSYAKYDDRIPQVVNTSAADDELSRSRRNSYATASGGPAREELYRGDHSSRRSTPLRSSVSIENIRPLYRSYYDGDARTPDAAVDYDDDSGYITGGPESSGRGGRSPYDGGTEDPHYGFTNFSSHPVVYQGKEYPTSEHLFQSFKFHEYRPELAERIRIGSKYPSSALAEAHRLADEVRPDWFEVNIEKMYETLRLKFSQHEGLRAELLSTGDAILVEASDKDAFWGSGPNGQGRNELGKALMRLRDELRALTFADPHA